jgi:tetratricopeptide (TPR) repeat protein
MALHSSHELSDEKSSVSTLFWMLAGAGVLYLLNIRETFVGAFGDDARDLLAARSLLHGRYASLQAPGHPPLNFPLPGFPLLLAPFTAIFHSHWPLMKIVPLAATLACGFMFSRLLAGVVRPAVRDILVLLFLFNPSTVFISGVVIADSFFLLLTLWVFCLLQRLEENSSPQVAWMVGTLAGWAALTRPEGILLVLAVFASLLKARRFFAAAATIIPASLLGGFWIGRNLIFTGHASGYSGLWRNSLVTLSHTSLLLAHWSRVAVSWFWEILAGISFGETIPFWILIPAAAGGIFAIWGALSWEREENARKISTRALGIFALAFFALHSLWTAVHPHYFFPMLPFSLLFLAKALEEIRRPRARLWAGGLLAAALTVLYAAQDYRQIKGASSQAPFPDVTFHWIRENVPLDGRHKILSERAPTVTLYTGRYSLAFIPAGDPEHFRFDLLQAGVSHVLVDGVPILFVSTEGRLDPIRTWRETTHWMDDLPWGFHPVFKNDAERTRIYEVHPSVAYVNAYQHYREGFQLFAEGKAEESLAQIEKAMELDPTLTSAMNAYAAVQLQQNGPLGKAEEYLRHAVRLRPDFAMAWGNLARVHLKQRRNAEARREFETAQTFFGAQGENALAEWAAQQVKSLSEQ